MADGSGGGGGDKGNVKVYMRVKPSERSSGYFAFDTEHGIVNFNIPLDEAEGVINNTRTEYKFAFDGIMDMRVQQSEVFDRVAREAVESALEGFNATIFAYGQTGSGKTFTITGGPERYDDRGIIPRALAHIFRVFKERKDWTHSAYVSYLEIYNEAGYDLLDPHHEFKNIEELPRVTMMEDEEGSVHLKNLAMHHVQDEEEALNYLFLGDTNRAICETPMNPVSSRSHCIFTISIEARQDGSPVIRRSKLHLVDLAGSERVHKTHAEGQLFREATHINKSLHFLEMVILALHERSTKRGKSKERVHVPYRNSMLTSVLRDSLGGNCRTLMVATINPEREHTGESISTCRFAQRVARVRNDAFVNMETDPSVLVRQLREQVKQLEAETNFLRGEAGEGEALGDDEHTQLREACRAWALQSDGTSGEVELPPTPSIGPLTLRRIHAAFAAFRELAQELRRSGGGESSGAGGGAAGGSGAVGAAAVSSSSSSEEVALATPSLVRQLQDEARVLRQQLQQRDNEIAILVNMVKQAKAELRKAGIDPSATTRVGLASDPGPATPFASLESTSGEGGGGSGGARRSPGRSRGDAAAPLVGTSAPSRGVSGPGPATPALSTAAGSAGSAGSAVPAAPTLPALPSGRVIAPELLADKAQVLELFQAEYPKLASLEENKRLLRDKYADAKAMGARVNEARGAISTLVAEVEKVRAQRALRAVAEGEAAAAAAAAAAASGGDAEAAAAEAAAAVAAEAGAAGAASALDAREEELTRRVEEQKQVYQDSFQTLRSLKGEIEYIQRLLEAGRIRMQADFESWYSNTLLRMQYPGGPPSSSSSSSSATSGAAAASSVSSASAIGVAASGGGRTAVAHGSAAPSAAGGLGATSRGGSAGGAGSATPMATATATAVPASVPLTGNPDADADIAAFFQAKEQLRRLRAGGAALPPPGH